MDQDQSRLLAIRQTEPHEIAGPRIDGGPGLDAQAGVPLLAVPLQHPVAGILVRDLRAAALHISSPFPKLLGAIRHTELGRVEPVRRSPSTLAPLKQRLLHALR